jgi:hypothetical protein
MTLQSPASVVLDMVAEIVKYLGFKEQKNELLLKSKIKSNCNYNSL